MYRRHKAHFAPWRVEPRSEATSNHCQARDQLLHCSPAPICPKKHYLGANRQTQHGKDRVSRQWGVRRQDGTTIHSPRLDVSESCKERGTSCPAKSPNTRHRSTPGGRTRIWNENVSISPWERLSMDCTAANRAAGCSGSPEISSNRPSRRGERMAQPLRAPPNRPALSAADGVARRIEDLPSDVADASQAGDECVTGF